MMVVKLMIILTMIFATATSLLGLEVGRRIIWLCLLPGLVLVSQTLRRPFLFLH